MKAFFLDWKFFLNTAGSELPFITIDEIKYVLANAPGSIIESFYLNNRDRLTSSMIMRRLLFGLLFLQDVEGKLALEVMKKKVKNYKLI